MSDLRRPVLILLSQNFAPLTEQFILLGSGMHTKTAVSQPSTCKGSKWRSLCDATESHPGKGEGCLLTVAIVQEFSDEVGTAGRPGLLGVHVSHHRSHDVVGAASLPIRTDALLGVIVKHVEHMAWKSRGLASVQGPIPELMGAPS